MNAAGAPMCQIGQARLAASLVDWRAWRHSHRPAAGLIDRLLEIGDDPGQPARHDWGDSPALTEAASALDVIPVPYRLEIVKGCAAAKA